MKPLVATATSRGQSEFMMWVPWSVCTVTQGTTKSQTTKSLNLTVICFLNNVLTVLNVSCLGTNSLFHCIVLCDCDWESQPKELKDFQWPVCFGPCYCLWIESSNYHIASSSDPEPWRKCCWWLPGWPADWERRILSSGISPVVTLHYRQQCHWGSPDRSHIQPLPTHLRSICSIWHTGILSELTSGESSATRWKNIWCFYWSR